MTGFAFTSVLKSTAVQSNKVASATDIMKYMIKFCGETTFCILLKGLNYNDKGVEPYTHHNIMYGFVTKYGYSKPVKETKISLQTTLSQTRRVALALAKVGEDSMIHRIET